MRLTSRTGGWSQFAGRVQVKLSPPALALERVFRNDVALARSKEKIRLKSMLPRVKVVVPATHGKQFRMIATLHNSSLLHNQDLIGTPDG